MLVAAFALPQTTFSQQQGYQVYLPLVTGPQSPPSYLLHIPYFQDAIQTNETAIFWFGEVYETENYADVRVGYTSNALYVRLAIFDRQVWYDTTPSVQDLTAWDSTALYLQLNGNTGSTPNASSYAFFGQLSWGEPNQEAAYQGAGGNWQLASIPFTSSASWVSDNSGVNDDNKPDRGWTMTYSIPFSSLGLSGPPAQNTTWGLGLVLFDRDDAAGNLQIPNKVWPPNMNANTPNTWGQISFGQTFSAAPQLQPDGVTTIRQGLNGATVKDGMVGGNFNCGQGLYSFRDWGEANYAGAHQINIQDQYNLSDWPCFSKYYVTFPLSSLPADVQITSANLTLYHFSNAGNGGPEIPTSLIQVMTVGDDWNENTLTWNNAPLPLENISQLWVPPNFTTLPIPRTWDVTSGVIQALNAGHPLRLVLYSADNAQHSGKYFISSDAGASGETNRPTLTINWANP